MRGSWPLGSLLLVGLVGLAGCLNNSSSDQDTDLPIVPVVGTPPAVDAAALLSDLESFVKTYPMRKDNGPDHEAARLWLLTQFDSYGLEAYRHNFNDGIDQANIVGIKWGNVRDEWVIVGGHYDMAGPPNCPESAPCPAGSETQGAYDDGSGTMMTVHLAKAFANLNTTYTIAFVAFDGEERGLQGSGHFAEDILSDRTQYKGIKFHAMLDLDMIGLNWPGVDAPIYFDSNSPQLDGTVMQLAQAASIPEGMIKYQGITAGQSDYRHFFELEVPTGFFISNFEEWQLPGNFPADGQDIPMQGEYPFWHVADTWETMLLMAGSPADLESGFQTAMDLAAGVLWHMATSVQPYDVEAFEG